MYFGYKLVSVIGEGTYGTVYKACKEKTLDAEPWIEFSEPTFALKRQKVQIKPESATATTTTANQQHHHESQGETSFSVTLLREVKLLRELNHPNIVRLADCQLGTDDVTILVFEYAEFEMMKMIDFYKQNATAIPEFTIKSFLYQALRGVEYLHENWVVHRDLKPDNILISGGNGPKRGKVVLADLGLARIFRNPLLPLGKVDKVVVTLWYRAPELILGEQNYSPAVDMWSMGCILASLMLAKEPNIRALFQGTNKEGNQNPFQSDQLDRIFARLGYPTSSTWPEASKLPEYPKMVVKKPGHSVTSADLRTLFPLASETCVEFMHRLLELNPAKRMTASEALRHPYLNVSPRPGENSLEHAGPLFAKFEDHAKRTSKDLDPNLVAQQREEIEARRLRLKLLDAQSKVKRLKTEF